MEKIKSPDFGDEKVWKAGKPKDKQQYQCKKCKRKFITELNYDQEFKKKTIQIFKELILIFVNTQMIYRGNIKCFFRSIDNF